MHYRIALPHIQTTTKAKQSVTKALLTLGSSLAALFGIGWVGLHLEPAPFPAVPQPSVPMETLPLPTGLPSPVERFYRRVYGERVPVIHSAVISGRGTMRPFSSLTLPMRFRFIHDAGHSYRHYIEATIFGFPLMKVNEYYIDGKERMELPFGVVEHDPRLDQGGNLGMWAEALNALPAILLTDPRVQWELVDDTTALLVVPFGEAREHIIVRFDPATNLPRLTEVMRYRGTENAKTLWLTESREDGTGTAMWLDEGRPWLVMNIESVVYNVDVDVSVTAKGP